MSPESGLLMVDYIYNFHFLLRTNLLPSFEYLELGAVSLCGTILRGVLCSHAIGE